jgi:hypothetical protein
MSAFEFDCIEGKRAPDQGDGTEFISHKHNPVVGGQQYRLGVVASPADTERTHARS